MAKSADEIERDLEQRRQKLQTHVTKLRERVAGDLATMRSQTQEEAAAFLHKAEAQIAEHPMLSLAGGFGTGVALGVGAPTPGLGKGGNGDKSNGSSGSGSEPGLLAKGFSAIAGVQAGEIIEEVRSSLQEQVSELVQSVKGNGTNANGRAAPSTGAGPGQYGAST